MSHSAVHLSVVIPFYNEEMNLRPLLTELRQVIEREEWEAEVVAVNDGSADATGPRLREFAAQWPSLRVVDFPRNSGQAAALWAGLHAARHDLIATLDGDGQNSPDDLPKLVAALAATGADMVVGWRLARRDSALRRAMSRIANAVRGRCLRDRLHDSGCAIKVMRRAVVGSFLPIRSLYSFMPAMAVAAGFTVVELPVTHRPRTGGMSNYGLRAMWWRPCCDMFALSWVLRRRIPLDLRNPGPRADSGLERSRAAPHGARFP